MILKAIRKLLSGNVSKPGLYIRLAMILIAFVCLILFARIWNNGQPINSISVSGISLIPESEITNAVKNIVINVPKNKIDMSKINHILSSNPFVVASYIKSDGIRSIDIEIIEREPAALVKNEDGELSFADLRSAVMPYRLFRQYSDLPVISGVYHYGELDTNALKNAVVILNELKQEENIELYKLISEIKYMPVKKQFMIYMADDGTKVLLGSASELSDKMANLYEFWKSKSSNPSIAGMQYLDVRWNGQVVAKF